MQQIDEEDRPAIRSILDRYGMPTFAMVGSDAESDFVDMIQHQPADFRQQALPKLKQNVDDGQASAKNYAMMYDRAQTDQGKPEMYGMNLICQPDGTLSPGRIIDPAQVEQKRAAIGLIPLKTYIRQPHAQRRSDWKRSHKPGPLLDPDEWMFQVSAAIWREINSSVRREGDCC